MKANELRIGNRLRWIDDPDRELIVSEIGFNNQKSKFVRFENGDGSIIEDEDCMLEPIPLTEEWLLKMGFEDVNFKGTYGFQFLDMYLSIYKSYGVWRIVFEKADRMLKIKYVHQLQNLYFALTGKNSKSSPN